MTMVRWPFGDRRPDGGGWPQGGQTAQPAAADPPRPPAAGRPPTGGREHPGERGVLWAPVVVGEPIFAFEPRPPAPGLYCPDTIFDGWSTKWLTMRLASVRGYAHRYRGIPRQDAAAVACHPPSDSIVVAVADGVSSAPRSHIGAATACQAAIDMIQRQLSVTRDAVNWAVVLEAAAASLVNRGAQLLGTARPALEAVEEQLATTLVAACITPTRQGPVASLVQIGDSGAWLLADRRYHPVFAPKNSPNADVISSAVTPLPRLPQGGVTPATVQMPAGSVLLLGTDGFGDPLGDGSGMVGRLFAEHLSSPPSAAGLAHLLDFSRETFDDDRTLAAVWPRPLTEQVPR